MKDDEKLTWRRYKDNLLEKKKRANSLKNKIKSDEQYKILAKTAAEYEERVGWEKYKELNKIKQKKDYIRE